MMRKQMQDEMIEKISVLEMKFRQIKETAQTAMFITCVVLLQNIKKKCAKSLPENRISFYMEVFDGILLALQKREKMNRKNLNEVCDLCTELLQFVKKELLKEKTTKKKKEILFLPYKASMWDSLESIWRAAAADKEHCEAYVMPIPYCDRNPDGSAAQWHCEANLFPSDIPVIDYREYNLKERRPDIIYIHNPYDGNNRVTSVAPEYYSNELKKYTDMLVYVPYFVAGESLSPHFAQLPGVLNADRVIVESDFIKKEYEYYYPGGNLPKNKILALGSPKFDKIEALKKASFYLEPEWQKLIQGKKVILYLTSINAALGNISKVNNKLKYVFSIFKNRRDIVLWWRPHPLLKATFQSMAPEILHEYEELEKVYIKEGWGIYDDSADLDRAIICTDAYYGDMSSVVWLYKVTQKSILIQNIQFCDRFRESYLKFIDCIVKDKKLWFVASDHNGLYCKNLVTEELRLVNVFPDENDKDWLFCKILETKNKLYFIPAVSKSIIEFDIETETFLKYTLPFNLQRLCEKGVFRTAFLKEDKIYCIPNVGRTVVVFNTKTKRMKCYRKWYEVLSPFVNDENSSIFGDALELNGIIWLPFRQGNLLVKFDLNRMSCEVIELGESKNTYFSITADKNMIYMVTELGDQILTWNIKKKKIISIQSINRSFNREFGYCIYFNEFLWLFPRVGNRIVKLKDTEVKEEYILNEKISTQFNRYKPYIYNEKLILPPGEQENLLMFDTKKHSVDLVETTKYPSPTDVGKNIGKIMREGYINLDEYIKYIIK